MTRRERRLTGDAVLDEAITALVDRIGPASDGDLVAEMLANVARLARAGTGRGDLKIVAAALREMRYGFSVFAAYRRVRKVSIFGSARTLRDDPLYEQARRLATALAAHDWMVVTGAGPGIMTAGIEGAGAENAFGVNIRLPFEGVTPALPPGDRKLINFRYFFTRKLFFVKESDGFALLPGGFGTLDEAFETLTLVQTGKAPPAPIVLLDTPGGTYWRAWLDFVRAELVARGYISPEDLDLVLVTDDVATAVEELTGFYANYHSIRFVGDRLLVRVRRAPAEAELAELSAEFAPVLGGTPIEVVPPTPAEVADGDALDCDRLSLAFDRRSWARLRRLIDRLNGRAR
jgi:uncharacterized protein (TIGR00730 family)